MMQTNLFILSILFIGIIGVFIFLSSNKEEPQKLIKTNERFNDGSHNDIITNYPRQHPVLKYQREASYDTHPASYGDPIRPLYPITGPNNYQKKSSIFR